MQVKKRLSCAVGNVFNDLYGQFATSFLLLFFMNVVELSASEAGLMILIGQITDALFSPISGYLGDHVNIPFFSKRVGRRKSWHFLATVLMAVAVPLLFNRCFLCTGNYQSWPPLLYFGFFRAFINICYNVVEINHMAVITTVAESAEECAVLSSMRTVFSFLSGVYIYAIAWGLLGQDSEGTLGPNNLSDFAYLSWIAAGTGVFFATVFLIGTNETQGRVRRKSTASGIMNAPGILVMPHFGRESAGSSQINLAHRFVDMIMASSQFETYQPTHNGHEENHQSHEQRERKKSLLQKFAAAIFSDEEKETGLTQSVPDPEEEAKNPDSVHAKSQMCLEVQQLDRERKKSLLVRFLDGLFARFDQEEEEQPKFTVEIDHHSLLGSQCERYQTSEDCCKKEEIKTFPNEETRNVYNNNEAGKAQFEEEEKQDDRAKRIRAIPETSMDSKRLQRKHAIVNTYLDVDNGLFNLGFEDDKSDDAQKGKFVSISDRKPQNSETSRAPGFNDMTSMDEGTQKKPSLVEVADEETILKESAQNYVEQEFSIEKNEASCEGNNNSFAFDDNPDLQSLPVPSDNFPSMKKRPKAVKDWLRDPNLYKVAIIFTCSRLAQDSVYVYLPLFLTESLLFEKEAIAYFPLLLLLSGSFSSSICNGLNRKIGSKRSYLLAGSVVVGCAVWSYFQTLSTKKSTYAQMIVIGSGLSIMQVMALVFITELIGENKETSGSVFAIITVIARLSSGGFFIGIQEFYPDKRTSSNGEVSTYVRHVFAMALGILTLIGSLLVLLYQPSNVSCEKKDSQDVEAQAVGSSSNVQLPGCSSKNEATSNVSLETNQSSFLATVYSSSGDKKL